MPVVFSPHPGQIKRKLRNHFPLWGRKLCSLVFNINLPVSRMPVVRITTFWKWNYFWWVRCTIISFPYCLLRVFSPLSRCLQLSPQRHYGPYRRRRPGSYSTNKGEYGILIYSSSSHFVHLNPGPDSEDDWTRWWCYCGRPLFFLLFVDILITSFIT